MNKENKIIQQVKDYIEKHLNEEMKLDDIAKTVGYSKFHLNRMFKDETGTTIHQYILKLRIEQSAQLLLNTDQTVLEVALNSGYATQQSYTVAFRQIYEITPQGYRIRHIQEQISMEKDVDRSECLRKIPMVNEKVRSEHQKQSSIISIEAQLKQTKVRMAA